MKIEKNLDYEPTFKNQITVEDKEFTITLEKEDVEIECSWDYGYGGRGTETMFIKLEVLKDLIKELEES